MDWPSKPTKIHYDKTTKEDEMSTHLFFNETIRINNCFSRLSGSVNQFRYNDHLLFYSSGRLYANWEDGAPISEDLKEFVTEVTYHDRISIDARRETGIYRLKSATCELTNASSSRNDRGRMFWIKVSATNTEDIKELVPLVLGGLVHPEISYERPTEGPTRQQLIDLEIGLQADLRLVREELAITEAKLATAEKERSTIQKEIKDLKDDLRKADDTMVHDNGKIADLAMMMGKLMRSGWPWVNARRLATEVFVIINREPSAE